MARRVVLRRPRRGPGGSLRGAPHAPLELLQLSPLHDRVAGPDERADEPARHLHLGSASRRERVRVDAEPRDEAGAAGARFEREREGRALAGPRGPAEDEGARRIDLERFERVARAGVRGDDVARAEVLESRVDPVEARYAPVVDAVVAVPARAARADLREPGPRVLRRRLDVDRVGPLRCAPGRQRVARPGRKAFAGAALAFALEAAPDALVVVGAQSARQLDELASAGASALGRGGVAELLGSCASDDPRVLDPRRWRVLA